MIASWPIGYDQSVCCVASTLTLIWDAGTVLEFRFTVDPRRFSVLSLHTEVGVV